MDKEDLLDKHININNKQHFGEKRILTMFWIFCKMLQTISEIVKKSDLNGTK